MRPRTIFFIFCYLLWEFGACELVDESCVWLTEIAFVVTFIYSRGWKLIAGALIAVRSRYNSRSDLANLAPRPEILAAGNFLAPRRASGASERKSSAA